MENQPNVPKVNIPLSEKSMMRKKAVARWIESKERQNLGWWRDYFERMTESAFLMGTTGKPDCDFHIDFLWVNGIENMEKVFAGRFRGNKRTGLTRRSMDNAKVIEEWKNQPFTAKTMGFLN
jgi:hypothetical protein